MLRMYLIKKRSPQKARKKPGTETISKAHRQDWKDECRKPGNIRRSIFRVFRAFRGQCVTSVTKTA